MSQSTGPHTDRYGLVFGYDTSETINSFKGEPTTNIAYAANNSLNSNGNWWFNSGESVLLDDDTTIPKPIIPNVDTSGLKIFSSRVTVVGNQHIGSAIIPVSPNTQYTMSIYFWFQGSTMQSPPYLRTAVNNQFVVAFNYNGDTNYLNWPRGKWIRLSATYTTPSNETGLYMTSYTGDFVGEKVAYFGYQLEQKSYMTPLVLGTRSITTGLYNIADNTNITLTNMSYNSSGNVIFDGSDDNMDADVQLTYGNCSIEMVCKWTTSISDLFAAGTGAMGDGLSGGTYLMARATPTRMWIGLYAPQVLGGGWYNLDGTSHSIPVSLTLNTDYHITLVNNQSTWFFYINGFFFGSSNHLYLSNTAATRIGIFRNHVQNIGNSGEVKMFKVYNNQTLNATDVFKNFNNYKKKYSLPYYSEGSSALTTYWNNNTTYNMAQFGGLGNVTAHGFTSGPATYTLTLPITNTHTQVRYRVFWHLVDSLDNEVNQLFVTNQTGNEVELLRFTKQYNLVPSISIQKVGVTATWSGHQTYTYRPWAGGAYGQDGYLTIDSGWFPHTGSSLIIRHVMGADQPQSDESQYLSHVEVDIL
jgi:hypothetical protein